MTIQSQDAAPAAAGVVVGTWTLILTLRLPVVTADTPRSLMKQKNEAKGGSHV